MPAVQLSTWQAEKYRGKMVPLTITILVVSRERPRRSNRHFSMRVRKELICKIMSVPMQLARVPCTPTRHYRFEKQTARTKTRFYESSHPYSTTTVLRFDPEEATYECTNRSRTNDHRLITTRSNLPGLLSAWLLFQACTPFLDSCQLLTIFSFSPSFVFYLSRILHE